jgi:hypothetical protein
LLRNLFLDERVANDDDVDDIVDTAEDDSIPPSSQLELFLALFLDASDEDVVVDCSNS